MNLDRFFLGVVGDWGSDGILTTDGEDFAGVDGRFELVVVVGTSWIGESFKLALAGLLSLEGRGVMRKNSFPSLVKRMG